MVKLIRTSTVAISLKILLKGQLSFLSRYFEVIGISSPSIILEEVAEQENINVFPVKMERRISILQDLMSVIRMIIILLKLRPVIVHSITPKAGLVTMLAAFITRIPIRIHTFTGLVFPSSKGIKKILLKEVDRLICFCATEIIPEGNGVKNDLLSSKITRKKLQVIGNGNVNGIDTVYFSVENFMSESLSQLKGKLQIKENDIVFCFVGRIVKDKGVNELLAVFNKLSLQYNNIKLLLIGPEERELDPISESSRQILQNNKQIISTGYQEDVRPYLAISDIFVFPSYREGFPNVVMQAGAMGLPSIVTDINGSNEIIKDGKNGIIIPVKNEKALYEKMELLLKDSILREKLSRPARKMVVDRYEQKYVWEELLNEYIRLLNEKGITHDISAS